MKKTYLYTSFRNGALGLTLGMLAAGMAVAQEEGEEGEEEIIREDDRTDGSGISLAPPDPPNPYEIIRESDASAEATDAIADAIRASYAFCAAARRPEYLVSCLSDQLKQISDSIPRDGDYAEAQAILAEASRKLQALAEANQSTTAPRVRYKGTPRRKPTVTRPLIPVRKEVVSQVNEAAADILEEAETKLLRSAAQSDRRLIHYAQMAQAVGSNKTLLRSA